MYIYCATPRRVAATAASSSTATSHPASTPWPKMFAPAHSQLSEGIVRWVPKGRPASWSRELLCRSQTTSFPFRLSSH